MTISANFYQPIDNLLERVSAVLCDLPGAVELYLYGSAADPSVKDEYSDLDIQVVTDDFKLSITSWPQVLEQVEKIDLAFPLNPIINNSSSSAFSIAFIDRSPYHKVDIGLCDRDTAKAFFSTSKHLLIWQQPASTKTISLPQGSFFIPEIDSAAHFLIGEMLSSIRYVKARKRGNHLSCWRFLSSKLNALLRCYAWNGDIHRFPESSLSTWNFNSLDRTLPQDFRLDLLYILNCESTRNMDKALFEYTLRILNTIQPSLSQNNPQSVHIATKYLAFVKQELDFT